MQQKLLLPFLATGFALFVSAMRAEQHEDGDKGGVHARETAKETAQTFLKAAKGKDLDALVKLTDIPWFDDGTQIIKDRAKLKELLKSAWVDFADDERFPSKIVRVATFRESRHMFQGQRQELADEVLAKDDWVVFLGRDGKSKGMLFVRLRDNRAKVVGAAQ